MGQGGDIGMNSHETVGEPTGKSQALEKLLMGTIRKQVFEMSCQPPSDKQKIPNDYKKWLINFIESPSNICFDSLKKETIKCGLCQNAIKEEAIKCRDDNLKHYLLQKSSIPANQKAQAKKRGNLVNIFHYNTSEIQELIEKTTNQLISLDQGKELDDVLCQTKAGEVIQQFSEILENSEKREFSYLM